MTKRPPNRKGAFVRTVVTVLAGAAVLACSAAAVFWADRQGWLTVSTNTGSASDTCRHHLPAGQCPFCDESLVAKGGSCVEHGVPEALCHQCNPGLVGAFKAAGDWCAGHDRPESQCTLCNPGLLKPVSAPATLPADPAAPQLIQADLPRSRRAPAVQCTKHTLRVQFASSEVARQAGLELEAVRRHAVSEVVTCNAELIYNRNRHARLSARAAGVVQVVHKDLGQAVAVGEVLAVIDSVALGRAKAAYLRAEVLVALRQRDHDREQALLRRDATSEREALEAETQLAEARIELAGARQELRNLGLSVERIAAVSARKDTSSLLEVTAPFAGRVIERDAVVGEVVDTDRTLFAVADTSGLWAVLDVLEPDARRVREGQAVVLRVEGLPGEAYAGRIHWVSSEVDRRTRTLKAYAEALNPNGVLRAHMFGRAEITVRDKAPALVVDKDAVQWDGCCNIVFVRRHDRLFEPRKVRLGIEAARYYVVEEGLEAGEPVVTTGSFLLKTEILKGSIGAGCCEVNPGA